MYDVCYNNYVDMNDMRIYVYYCWAGEEDGQARGPRGCGPDAPEGSPQHLPLPDARRARADVHRHRVPAVGAEKLGLRIRVDAHATGDDSLEGMGRDGMGGGKVHAGAS